MVQILPQQQMSPIGQVVSGFGTNFLNKLAESIPKRMEEKRLSEGLSQLSKEAPNLSNSEYLSRLESIPGVSAETKRQLGETKRQESLVNAYKRKPSYEKFGEAEKEIAKEGVEERKNRQAFQDVSFGNFDKSQPQRAGIETIRPPQQGEAQPNPQNPLRQEALPVGVRTPQQRDAEIGEILNNGFASTPEQAMSIQADNERRDIANAEAQREKDRYLNSVQGQMEEKFKKSFELKLQKTGEGTFGDITGDMRNNLIRGMENDLAEHRNLSVDDAVDKWTTKALDLSKAKNNFLEVANSVSFTDFFSKNKENKLKEYADIFRKNANSEEYYNLLQSKVGLSPQYAASIAYTTNPESKKVVDQYKPNPITDLRQREDSARKLVKNLNKTLTDGDSLLAIAKQLRDKDPNFDQQSFFEQLSLDKDYLRLNERQRREIAIGASSALPNWNDFLISSKR